MQSPFLQTDFLSFDSSAYQKEILKQTKQQETIIYSTIIAPKFAVTQVLNEVFEDSSSEKEIIVSSDNFGTINVSLFRIREEGNFELEKAKKKQKLEKEEIKIVLNAHQSPIFTLCFSNSGKILLSGGTDSIKGWDWNKLLSSVKEKIKNESRKKSTIIDFSFRTLSNIIKLDSFNEAKSCLLFVLPSIDGINQFSNKKNKGGKRECNSIVTDNIQEEIIYSACGDNNCYAWDINVASSNSVVSTFSGHTGYILCLARSHMSNKTQQKTNKNILISGSDDGTIRFWDPRSTECTNVLDPFQSTKLSSKNSSNGNSLNSRWITTLSFDESDNWLACGIGASGISPSSINGSNGHVSCIYHSPSLSLSCYLPSSGITQAISFTKDDHIISVGNDPYVYYWKLNGELIMRVLSSSRSLFSIAHNEQMIVVSGTGRNSLGKDSLFSPALDFFTQSTNYTSIYSRTMHDTFL